MPNPNSPPFAIVIPLGPNDYEVERTRDILDAVTTFEVGNIDVVLLHDRLGPDTLSDQIKLPPGFRLHVLAPERDRSAPGLYGGLTWNLLQLLRFVVEHTRAEYVLRLDTDAHVIAPFVEKLSAEFEAAGPDCGIVGCCRRAPTDAAVRPLEPWKTIFGALGSNFGVTVRSPRVGNVTPFISIPTPPHRSRVKKLIQQALLNGYKLGECPMGGAYAYSRALLVKLQGMGAFDHGPHWKNLHVTEDAAFSVYCHAANFKMVDSFQPGETFAVEWKALSASPQELITDGYSVVHSTKACMTAPLNETQIRDLFREARAIWKSAGGKYPDPLILT